MNASYEWLRAFVPFAQTPAQLRDLLTSRVATVDEMIGLRDDLRNIVVARVVEAARHPDSDHLWLTRVDAGGSELLDVVCGAPNVAVGSSYPFAPVGSVLPGGLKLERRKIRGIYSNGMLCSARELGLGESGEGILELQTAAAPGTALLDAMPVGDTRFVIDVLPNRADLLSHAGLAREIAAATGLAMHLPAIPDAVTPAMGSASGERGASVVDRQLDEMAAAVEEMTRVVERNLGISIPRPASQGESDGVRVELRDPLDAPRYVGLVVRGVTVGASPEWLVRRLASVGARSINNIVDVTNYVMHELGQPLHAFDLAKLAGNQVIIRRATPGERLRTLDGVDRVLDAEMTVIADAERAHALAGVMGGADSEVSAGTREIFLEAASFDPRRTRLTRRRLGLTTDASHRFERGVDVELAPVAIARAAAIITAVAGGEADGVPIDLHPRGKPALSLTLSVERVTRLLGTEVSAAEIRTLLGGIGFGVAPEEEPGTLRVAVPSWRGDVTRPVDLVEEVARLRGYDTFPDELRPYRPSSVPDAPLVITSDRVREAMVRAGLYEVRPIPFTRGADTGFVRVANPLAENEAYLRTDLLDTLARRAEHNLAHMQGNVRLFEIGAAFAPDEGTSLPREELRAAALVMGDRRPVHFTEPKPPAFDEWDAKGLAEGLASAAFPGAVVVVTPSASSDDTLWDIIVSGKRAGRVARVPLDAPLWAAPAFGVELTIARVESAQVAPPGSHAPASSRQHLAGSQAPSLRYVPLPTTPASEVDLALLVPDDVPAGRVEEVIRSAAGELLERLVLFDEFTGTGVPNGRRSLAWRLTFRHPERTLRDKEVEGRRSQLLRALENELGVTQRTT